LQKFCIAILENPIVDIIIPALNEEKSIRQVIESLPKCYRKIIVCNNGSTDRTMEIATQAGAIVVNEPIKGYGIACKKGLQYLDTEELKPDIIVFLDADFSDYPEEIIKILYPIYYEDMDLVIGNRLTSNRLKGSMTFPQIFGNWLSTKLIKLFWGYNFSDLGPFRAIRYNKLLSLDMQDDNYGWTVEMQLKAAKNKLKCCEVPVNYRPRIGVSKVSGTIKGTILAGYKILWVIFKYGLIKTN